MDCQCIKQDNYTVPRCIGTQCDQCPECTTENSRLNVLAFLSNPNSNIETVPLWLVYTLAGLLVLVILSTIALITQT